MRSLALCFVYEKVTGDKTLQRSPSKTIATVICLPHCRSRSFKLLKFCPCKCCGLSQIIWTRVRPWSKFLTISWTLQSQLIALRSMRKNCKAGNPSNVFGIKFSMSLWKSSLKIKTKNLNNFFWILSVWIWMLWKLFNFFTVRSRSRNCRMCTYNRCNRIATTFGNSEANETSLSRLKSVLCSTLIQKKRYTRW